MKTLGITSGPLLDAIRPQARGEPVNVHVMEDLKEPETDFEALRRVIEGEDPPKQRDEQKESAKE